MAHKNNTPSSSQLSVSSSQMTTPPSPSPRTDFPDASFPYDDDFSYLEPGFFSRVPGMESPGVNPSDILQMPDSAPDSAEMLQAGDDEDESEYEDEDEYEYEDEDEGM